MHVRLLQPVHAQCVHLRQQAQCERNGKQQECVCANFAWSDHKVVGVVEAKPCRTPTPASIKVGVELGDGPVHKEQQDGNCAEVDGAGIGNHEVEAVDRGGGVGLDAFEQGELKCDFY